MKAGLTSSTYFYVHGAFTVYGLSAYAVYIPEGGCLATHFRIAVIIIFTCYLLLVAGAKVLDDL